MEFPMKVLLLCKSDHANLAYDLQECLRSVGIDARAFKDRYHPSNYTHQAKVVKANGFSFYNEELKKFAEDAEIIVYVHSEFIDVGVPLNGKKVYVMHTGSKYRQDSKTINKIFNPIVTATLCGCDVLGMGAFNEIWIQAPINVSLIKPVYDFINKNKLVIAHYPSSPKGIEIITPVIDKLKNQYDFEFIYDLNKVSWEEQINRCGKCDIYIENIVDKQGNIDLKTFGITTLELAALGKIPITRFPIKDEYEKRFGKCGIIATNSPEDLEKKLRWLLELDNNEILRLKKEARDWVERCHSYEAIGNMYKNIFEGV